MGNIGYDYTIRSRSVYAFVCFMGHDVLQTSYSSISCWIGEMYISFALHLDFRVWVTAIHGEVSLVLDHIIDNQKHPENLTKAEADLQATFTWTTNQAGRH